MSGINFVITEIFDIADRGGLLVAGTVNSGTIASGAVLRDCATGERITVLGIEFARPSGPNQVTLIVDRTSAAHVRVGHVLMDS